MKNNIAVKPQTWKLINASLAGVVLLAGLGCNCININTGSSACCATSAPAPQHGSPGSPPPAGGNFTPVQAATVNGGTVTVCGIPCPGKYVRFYPPNAYPGTGDTGFRGYIWNVSANAVVPNTNYVLQFFVSGSIKPCATPVAGSTTDVSCPVSAGLTYRITAYFKSGYTPGATNLLLGNWTQ